MIMNYIIVEKYLTIRTKAIYSIDKQSKWIDINSKSWSQLDLGIPQAESKKLHKFTTNERNS